MRYAYRCLSWVDADSLVFNRIFHRRRNLPALNDFRLDLLLENGPMAGMIPQLPITSDFTNGSPQTVDLVSPSVLDAKIAEISNAIGDTRARLGSIERADNTLADAIVRTRCLHAEVLEALSTATVLPMVSRVFEVDMTLSGVPPVCSSLDEVLLAGQTDQAENGIWIVSSGAWGRRSDMQAGSTIETTTIVYAADGSRWSIAAGPVVGTDEIEPEQTGPAYPENPLLFTGKGVEFGDDSAEFFEQIRTDLDHWGSPIIPAAQIAAGRLHRVRLSGLISTYASPVDLVVKLQIGSKSVSATFADLPADLSGASICIEGRLSYAVVLASVIVTYQIRVQIVPETGDFETPVAASSSGALASQPVDDLALQLSLAYGTADVANVGEIISSAIEQG